MYISNNGVNFLTNIHETAIIHENVEIGDNVTIHPYCVIGYPPEHKYEFDNGGGVVIGEGSILFPHTLISQPTNDKTIIGKNNFIMGGSHIGHDCKTGDNVILGGSSMLAGHSVVQEGAFIGDGAVIHQWAVVGAYTIVGMNTPLNKNAYPFIKVYGSPPRWRNLNTIALSKSSIPNDEKRAINSILSQPFNDVSDLAKALKTLDDDFVAKNPHVVEHFENFLWQIAENQSASRQVYNKLPRYDGKIVIDEGMEIRVLR